MYKFAIIIIIIIVLSVLLKIYISQSPESIHISIPTYSVKEFKHFLSDKECDTIINLSKNKLIDSTIYYPDDNKVINSHRTSKQCWLTDNVHPVIKKISEKTSQITGKPIDHQEFLQVVRYESGGFFNPHYDSCDLGKKKCERMDSKAGPRLATFLIYLNDNYTGGETTFPNINYTVKPEKGKAVLFYDIDEKSMKLITESLHSGSPVKSGEKWICNKWVRVNRFV